MYTCSWLKVARPIATSVMLAPHGLARLLDFRDLTTRTCGVAGTQMLSHTQTHTNTNIQTRVCVCISVGVCFCKYERVDMYTRRVQPQERSCMCRYSCTDTALTLTVLLYLFAEHDLERDAESNPLFLAFQVLDMCIQVYGYSMLCLRERERECVCVCVCVSLSFCLSGSRAHVYPSIWVFYAVSARERERVCVCVCLCFSLVLSLWLARTRARALSLTRAHTPGTISNSCAGESSSEFALAHPPRRLPRRLARVPTCPLASCRQQHGSRGGSGNVVGAWGGRRDAFGVRWTGDGNGRSGRSSA